MSDAAEAPILAPGEEVAAGYRVIAHMRRGEDLDVYDVWSEERECRCIAKTVRSDRLTKSSATARLRREGRLLLRLTHPHLVRAYELLADPRPTLILETLPGETLAHLVDRRPRGLDAAEVAQLGLQLCTAVGYLHRHGVLHLDLKPSNIIAACGLAKVLDFSVARPPGPHRGEVGTAGYMAPEQCAGGDLGAAADVWGIGINLHEAASGEPACDSGEAASDSDAPCVVCVPRPLRRFRRQPALAAIINRCLSPRPADRPTIAELTRTLTAVATEVAATDS